MLSNELVNRNVKHVEFDCQVGADHINAKFFLVVHNDHFWSKSGLEILLGAFKRFAGIKADALNTAYLIAECSMNLCLGFNISCSLSLEIINSISFFWEVGILVLLAPSLLELLDISGQVDYELRQTKGRDEFKELISISLSVPIKDEFGSDGTTS